MAGCPLATLLRRVAGRDNRPLLSDGDPAEVMRRLMDARYPIYAEADVVVDCGDESPYATTGHVLNALLDWRAPRRLSVVLSSTSYDLVIGEDLLSRAGALLAPRLGQKRAVVVTDETVARLHLRTLLDGLAQTAIATTQIVVPPGEASKSLQSWQGVVDQLLEARVERRTTVIAFGGGVVGDLAGFAAATTLRGLPFVQIPTTLLSQVDFVRRRQDRSEHVARQEPGGRVLSASDGARRHRDARHFAATRTARRLRGNRQGRADRRCGFLLVV